MPGHGLAAGSSCGVIVVAHGPNQAVTEQSFVVSFPVGTCGKRRQLAAVSDRLAALGWSLLPSKRQKTELGHADIAVLVNTSRFGGRQRLRLAEPVEAHSKAGHAPKRGWPGALPARSQAGPWSNAGSDTVA